MLCLSNPIHHATTLPFCDSYRRREGQLHVTASVVAKHTTLYDTLLISPTVRQEEIKVAFKKAALRCHPDTCQSPADKQLFTLQFKQARKAYEVLSDPLHRLCYDVSIGIGDSFARKERREGCRVWEIQLEGLRRRARSEDTWAARVRRANQKDQSSPSD